MRIATLTNKGASLPELGRIRLGEVKTDPKRPGKPLPYFRVDFHPAYQHLESVWNALYPTPPDRLDNIFMPFDKADESFMSAYEEWTGAKVLARRCDGQHICLYHDAKTLKYHNVHMPCQCAVTGKQDCRMVGRLSFIVRDFFEFAAGKGVNALGRFTMTTNSKHNISRIDSLLQGIEALYGSVKKIPFVLTRTTEEISTPVPEDKEKNRQAQRILKKQHLLTLATAEAFAPFAAAALLSVGPQAPASPAAPALPEYATPEDDESINADDMIVPLRNDVTLIAAHVLKDRDGKRYLRFDTDQGVSVYRRSRDLFISAGWIKEGDWQEFGEYKLPNIGAIVEQDEHEYWQVVHVFPAGD